MTSSFSSNLNNFCLSKSRKILCKSVRCASIDASCSFISRTIPAPDLSNILRHPSPSSHWCLTHARYALAAAVKLSLTFSGSPPVLVWASMLSLLVVVHLRFVNWDFRNTFDGMMCDYRNGGRLRYLPVPNSPPVSILHDPASLTPISCGCAC